jgi:hypothetical protein
VNWTLYRFEKSSRKDSENNRKKASVLHKTPNFVLNIALMPMYTFKKPLYLLIFILLASACNNMQVFRMDVLKPGYVVVPSQKSNLILVDNTGVQPRDVGHAVKMNFKYVGDTAFSTEALSGLLVHSLSQYLLKEGFYRNILPVGRKELPTPKDGEEDFQRSSRLSNKDIAGWSRDTSAHLLVSLDRLLTKTTTNTYFGGDFFVATRDVWVNTVWRVYDLDADTVVAQFQYNDSLFWRKMGSNALMATEQLPTLEEVLPEIGDVVAENVHVFLGPHWETVKREYFCSGSYRMTMAADLVRKEELAQAAELWKLEYAKGQFRSKYRAAINMMLFEEAMGRPVQALEWVTKAEDAIRQCPIGGADYDIDLLARSKMDLQVRLKEFQKLKIYFDGNLN